MLTPKCGNNKSIIKQIAVAAIYYRGPKSTKKQELFDHIAESYNLLLAKYGNSLDFIIGGDTNRLKLSPILNLSPSLKQVVTLPTRLDPPVTLDPIITTLQKYYQPPVTKPAIGNDADKNGKPSDHLVVLMLPISVDIVCPARQIRIVEYRPLPHSGINKMGQWIQQQKWKEIYECLDAHEMANKLQNVLIDSLDRFLPMKTIKFCNDDDPWVTEQVKVLDRKCKRDFSNNQKSEKWQKIYSEFKLKC